MNKETANDRFKLAHHRVVARALRARPDLLVEAREVVRAWKLETRQAHYVKLWDDLLALPVEIVRREITCRTAELARLRRSSPFALTPTKVLSSEGVARLRKVASRQKPIES